MKAACSVDGCETPVYCRGWCGRHYHRWLVHGSPLAYRPEAPTAGVRFMQNVDKTRSDTCWWWTGHTNHAGYGQFTIGSRKVRAHRWMYEQTKGEVPAGLELDHLCRNRACVNPDHLEPVDHAENIRRAQKETCAAGHPLPSPITGRRVCRACANMRNRKYKGRKSAERKAAQAPKPVVHNRSRYVKHRCRCEICCAAEADYQKQRRAFLKGTES